jgi:hypothetical protein
VPDAPDDGVIYGRKDGEWVDMTSEANLQVRRGTAAEVAAITPLEGEPVWTTDAKRLYVGDGVTQGGIDVGAFPLNAIRPSSTVSTLTPGRIFAASQMEIYGQIAGTTYVAGNTRGSGAVDFQTIRSAATQVASGGHSTIVNGTFNAATNQRATVLNGINCTASGADSTVLGGYASTASGTNSLAFHGTASATSSVAFHGTASGFRSVSFSGTASGENAVALGGTADRHYMLARAGGTITNFTGRGQEVALVMRGYTTDTTATELTLGGTGTPKLTIPNNVLLSGVVEIVGTKTADATVACHYLRKFTIRNVSNTTTLIESASVVGTDYETDAGLEVSLSADDTGDFLKIEVTGLAATNMRWLAIVRGAEIAL